MMVWAWGFLLTKKPSFNSFILPFFPFLPSFLPVFPSSSILYFRFLSYFIIEGPEMEDFIIVICHWIPNKLGTERCCSGFSLIGLDLMYFSFSLSISPNVEKCSIQMKNIWVIKTSSAIRETKPVMTMNELSENQMKLPEIETRCKQSRIQCTTVSSLFLAETLLKSFQYHN